MDFREEVGLTSEVVELNMGPQHPSTHGVFRVVLQLDHETIVSARSVIGYLHRGTEKIAENLQYFKVIPYTDRLDYLAPLSNNLAYVLAVEKLLGITDDIPERAKYIRVILAELSRIESHLVWLGSHATDIGAVTVFLYAFREREKIYDLLEELTGQRMNNAFLRIGGLMADFPEGFEEKVRHFVDQFPKTLRDLENLLTKNPIWLNRTKGIGVIPKEKALDLGATGPVLRGSGIAYDVRKYEPYCVYDRLSFDVPTGTHGDVYDRYLVRMEEMRQSVSIIRQCLDQMPEGDVLINDFKVVPPPKSRVYASIEEMIHHFKHFTEGVLPPKGEVYASVEGPKGELGFYIVSDGTGKPWRVRIRPAAFMNIQILEHILPGHYIADAVAIIGSLDPVLGEVDR